MSKANSDDLRSSIVHAVEQEGLSQPRVAARFAVSLASVKRYLHRWRTTGELTPRPHPGRHRAISSAEHDRLIALLTADPDVRLADYCARWQEETGVCVSASTMCRAQQRVGWTVKKVPHSQRAGRSGTGGMASDCGRVGGEQRRLRG